jgi:putative oxidoreductase
VDRCVWDQQRRLLFVLSIIRITVAGLLAAHGWSRLITGGIVPFGEWLTGNGFPLGFFIAAAITALEIIGTSLLAFRKFVFPLAIAYSLVLSAGVVMVHAPAGWFVVGNGRNGMEYSVLLIVCLLSVGFVDMPRFAKSSDK